MNRSRTVFGTSARSALSAHVMLATAVSAAPPIAGSRTDFDSKLSGDDTSPSLMSIGDGNLMGTGNLAGDTSVTASVITEMANSSGAWSAMNEKNTLAGSCYAHPSLDKGSQAGALH